MPITPGNAGFAFKVQIAEVSSGGFQFTFGTRISNTLLRYYQTTSNAAQNTSADSGSLFAVPFCIAARGLSASTEDEYSFMTCKFAWVGAGLSGSQITALYNAVRAYQEQVIPGGRL